MVLVVSRRRAVTRGLGVLGGIVLAARGLWQPASAQQPDPFSDAPSPDQVPANVPLTPPASPPVPAAQDGAAPADPVGQGNEEGTPLAQPLPDLAPAGPWGVRPAKLTIPALGVEAVVEPVGHEDDGTMAAPTHPDQVAWYEPGPGMGVPGNVVFAAHVNWDGRLRPFGLLHRLEPGDAIQVIDAEGRGFEYAVETSHWVRAEGAPIEEIFAQPATPVITLITCGGEYVAATREYLDRLIVKARGA